MLYCVLFVVSVKRFAGLHLLVIVYHMINKERTRRREKRKEKKKIVRLPARVLNSRPSCFPIQYTNALS